jgi:hypothetical protein
MRINFTLNAKPVSVDVAPSDLVCDWCAKNWD